MKLTVLCLCFLHLALVSCRLFTRNDLQAARSNVSDGGGPAPRSTGSLNQDRVKPLFARRGQYEQQRIHVSNPAKMSPNPMKSTCSQLTQSCLPLSGCCDPCATCHCRFFNAICFCRRAKSQYEKKTQNASTPKLRHK